MAAVQSTARIIFYSWQSDLPNAANRTFIAQALEGAAKALKAEEALQIEPVVRSDTQGIPGSPDIAQTIFRAIKGATVFVADVSIINPDAQTATSPDTPLRLGRPAPNPNVLVELGYALDALGDDNVLLAMNTAFGGPELLPFDLRMRRIITYHSPEHATERATERKALQGKLAGALRAIFEQPMPVVEPVQPLPLAEQARVAVEDALPKQVSLVKQYMKQLAADVAALMPPFQDAGQSRDDDRLVASIETTRPIVAAFSRLVEAIANSPQSDEAARAMYGGFTHLLDLYWTPRSFTSGPFYEEAFDLPKFLGHETFVTLFALLIREDRWQLIGDLLAEDLYVNTQSGGRPGMVPLGYVSQYLPLLDRRKQRLQLNYITIQGYLLNERHTTGEVADIMPMEQFAEADYLLYLRGQVHPDEQDSRPGTVEWRPWSTIYLREVPRYLTAAVRVKGAERLLYPLGLRDIPTLRQRFAERAYPLGRIFGAAFWQNPMDRFDPQNIGTRP